MPNDVLKQIVDSVEKVIIGKREAVENVVCSLICRGHVLIEDVPGVGKTSLISALARSLDCSFKRIQFTPDIMPSDITGFSMFNQKSGEFEYKRGAVMSQIVLADEINRTSPKTQSSLLEVMEEKQVTVDGVTYPLPQPFMVLATQNPVEYLGTYPLPEAQLDRFFMKIHLGYPSPKEEEAILWRFRSGDPLSEVTPVVKAGDVIELQREVAEVYVDSRVGAYIVALVGQTRENKDVVLGGSPRSTLALSRAAQSWAFYQGRNFVTPDDVQKMAANVLEHRIVLKQEARLRKVSAVSVVESALSAVQVPVL